VHLGKLKLGLGADTLGEGGVADHVSKGLAIRERSNVSVNISIVSFQRGGKEIAIKSLHRDGLYIMEVAYRSGSYCWKTLLLVWSRIARGLTNPLMSSLFARNWDMVDGKLEFA
jgi:hypothetical protein